MGRATELPDAEAFALHAELQRIVEECKAERRRRGLTERGVLRQVGLRLEFDRAEAQQQVSAALKRGRVGERFAERLYKYLGMSREEFLRSKGLVPEPSIAEQVLQIAAERGGSAADALRVLRALPPNQPISDKEIVRRLAFSSAQPTTRLRIEVDERTGDTPIPPPFDEEQPDFSLPKTPPRPARRRT